MLYFFWHGVFAVHLNFLAQLKNIRKNHDIKLNGLSNFYRDFLCKIVGDFNFMVNLFFWHGVFAVHLNLLAQWKNIRKKSGYRAENTIT